ncbi:hypothetical protein [Vulcanisaeta distributa]|uniref:hypothetical protein n=1 Tax=Vulcanisaeta distributa TaxID=164451 RepID=UPI0006D21DB8|nr:hypothetical protein [Vulcanisaeta distributa]
MALADLVLEGLTLILAIALGLVLIGGLTYLTITVSTTNNARLAYTGLYIYLPQPIYVNGTLYIPMYNIGYYRAVVKYVYVKGIDGSIHEYAPNLVLGVNQYYVYTLSLGYEPTSITVLASPMDYPGIIKEFSVNVSTVNSIPLIPQSQSQPSSGLIDVTVNDPYNAGWEVTWSYAGQSYSVSQAQSYTWFINPPYVPIQISFTASITSTPNGYYQCQVVPSRVANTYNAGSVQEFNVFCYSVVIQVNDPYGAGWSIGLTPPSGLSWSGSSTQTIYVNQTLNYPQSVSASITSIPPGYQSCSITGPTQITGPGTYTYNVQCQGGVQVYLSVTFTPYKSYVCTYYVSGDALLQYPNGTQKYYYIFFTTTTTTTKTYYLYNGPPGVTVKSIDIDYTSSTLYNANCGDSETQSYNPNPPVTFGINGVYTIYGNVAATSSSSNSGSSGYAEFYLTVNAPSGYSWTVTASGAVSESASGTGPVSNSWWFSIHPTNSPIYFSASKGCTVSPSTITPSSAGNYYVTVNCGGSSSSGSISVSVQDSYGGAGWSVSWSGGGASGSKSGSSSASWSITASGTVDFTALITSNPSSYTCTISPTSTSANPGGSVTFTVSCTSNNQPPPSKYYCIVKPSAGDNVGGGASGAYVSPSGTQYLSPRAVGVVYLGGYTV